MEFAWERASRGWVAIEKAAMEAKIAGMPRLAMTREVDGCSAGENAGLEQLTGNERGRLRLAEAYSDVDPIGDHVAECVADQQLERKLRVRIQKFGEPRRQYRARDPGINIHPKAAARRMGCPGGLIRRAVEARNQGRDLCVEAASIVGQVNRARAAIEQAHTDACFKPGDGAPFTSRSLMRCFDQAAASFGWHKRDPRPGSMRDGDWLIGYGCASSSYPVLAQACAARIRLTADGRAHSK
jgi:hypothetical protein